MVARLERALMHVAFGRVRRKTARLRTASQRRVDEALS